MKSTLRPLAAFAAGATLLLVASCTSSTADGPTSTDVVSVTVSPSVVDPSTPTSSSEVSSSPSAVESSTAVPESSDISPQEAADRAAVELAWSQFWSVSDNLWRLPEQDRAAAASAVAVEPTASQIIEQAQVLQEKGLEAYGTRYFHPYWEAPIAGQAVAKMGDCTDTSQSGAQNVATGTKVSVGVPKRNTSASFIKGTDGQWRVHEIEYLVETPCP